MEAVRALKPGTVRRYRQRLDAFLDDARVADGVELRADHLTEHLRSLYLGGLSASTRRGAYVAARSFGESLVIAGEVAANPFARVPSPKPEYREEIQVLTRGEVERLIYGDPPGLPEDPLAARNRVLCLLIYWLGLRPSELGLRLDGLVRSGRSLKVRLRHTKWASEDQYQVLSDPRALSMLGDYGAVHRPTLVEADEDSPWLVPSVRRCGRGGRYRVVGPLRSESVSRIVAEEMRRAGIRKRGRQLSPKILRHSLATHLLEAGWEPAEVQEHLRHRSIQTTQLYTHVRPGRIESLLRSRSPLGSRPGA